MTGKTNRKLVRQPLAKAPVPGEAMGSDSHPGHHNLPADGGFLFCRGEVKKTVKQLVDEINAAKIYAAPWVDEEIDLDGAIRVAGQDLEEHRWYVVGTVVFQKNNEFFGVRGPVSLKSESMGFRDVEMECVAFEMEQVPSVTYKKK
jgi:hypothetical protein